MDWTFAIGTVSFGILDIVSVALILISAIACLALGFSRSAGRCLGWVLCFPVALIFTSLLANLFIEKGGLNPFLSSLLSFVLLAMVTFLLFHLLGALLSSALSAMGLAVVDSILGFLFGIVIMAIIITCVIALFNYQKVIDVSKLLNASVLYRRVYAPLFPKGVDIVKGIFNELTT